MSVLLRRRRRWVPIAVLVLLSPAIYSWTSMAVLPSSLPLGVRTVEWLRTNHLNWLVDNAEHVYYTWKAPKKGGPQLSKLPAVGLGAGRTRSSHGRRESHPHSPTPCPARESGSLQAPRSAGDHRCS
jgi:hypothetical protein